MGFSMRGMLLSLSGSPGKSCAWKKQKFPLSLVLEQDSAFILFKEFIQVFVFRT